MRDIMCLEASMLHVYFSSSTIINVLSKNEYFACSHLYGSCHVHNSGSQNQVRLLLLLFFFERCILFSLFLVFLSVWQLAAACHSQNFSLDTTFSFKKK
jgi:hypothetical protein